MQNKPEDGLDAFFEAAGRENHTLPEAARRRILIEAEAMRPKAKQKTKGWFGLGKLRDFWVSVPASAAMASLALGIFVGVSQPDSVSALAGFSAAATDSELEAETDFLPSSYALFYESDLSS